jgi:hypothetical protein
MTVFVRSVCGAFQREFRGDPLWGGPYITLSTYACRKRSNSEQERPNSGDTGGAEGASDKMSSQCAVPLPHTTMGLGECHKARDSRRTRLTASDKLDFLTAPIKDFVISRACKPQQQPETCTPAGPTTRGGSTGAGAIPGSSSGAASAGFWPPRGC